MRDAAVRLPSPDELAGRVLAYLGLHAPALAALTGVDQAVASRYLLQPALMPHHARVALADWLELLAASYRDRRGRALALELYAAIGESPAGY